MTTHLKLKAYGKINLALDVLRKREDGYHDVRMIMQTVGIYDQLELQATRKPGIAVETNLSYLPVNENNLVYQAAKLLMDEFSVKSGIHITLLSYGGIHQHGGLYIDLLHVAVGQKASHVKVMDSHIQKHPSGYLDVSGIRRLRIP